LYLEPGDVLIEIDPLIRVDVHGHRAKRSLV
jgi:hypothetical protein